MMPIQTTGRKIFLWQLEVMKKGNHIRKINELDAAELKRLNRIAKPFHVPKNLREAFFEYYWEFINNNRGESTRTDGTFFNDEDTKAGIEDKFYHFFEPMIGIFERTYGISLSTTVNPSYEDATRILATSIYQTRELPFCVVFFDSSFKSWYSFFDRQEFKAVYEQLESWYDEMVSVYLKLADLKMVPKVKKAN
jgi:hypothetical protein